MMDLIIKKKMKIIELEKFIQNLSPDLYSFAYILIPDDLQATQLMIDAVGSFMIQNKFKIEKWISKDRLNNLDHQSLMDDIKNSLLKLLFEISKKRINQLKLSLSHPEEDHSFFQLEFNDKAVLYLKEKGQLDLNQIELVTSLTRSEVLAHLYSARLQLIDRLPSIYKRSLEQVSET